MLHPAGELARQTIGEGTEGGEGQQTGESLLTGFTGHATQIGVQIKVFHHRQVFIETKLLRHIAEHGVECTVIFNRIEPEHAGRPFIGLKQACQHPHQRGFACAVRTNQPGYIAFLDGAVQRRDGRFFHAREAFDQIVEPDNRVIHVVPRCSLLR